MIWSWRLFHSLCLSNGQAGARWEGTLFYTFSEEGQALIIVNLVNHLVNHLLDDRKRITMHLRETPHKHLHNMLHYIIIIPAHCVVWEKVRTNYSQCLRLQVSQNPIFYNIPTRLWRHAFGYLKRITGSIVGYSGKSWYSHVHIKVLTWAKYWNNLDQTSQIEILLQCSRPH